MIPLEARMLPGLDEFMLRLGHLKVLCRVAVESGGSLSRIERETASALTRLVPVPDDMITHVADYLRRKRLCSISGPEGSAEGDVRSDYRYPELWIDAEESDARAHVRTSEEGAKVPRIWWQDLCLAAPGIRSRVGAVTTGGKAGSKTGVSHICDWAIALDLLGRSGELSPEGRLIARFDRGNRLADHGTNPYLIGHDRVIFAYLLLSADADVFAHYAPRLLRAAPPIRKSDAAEMFAEAISQIATEAESSRHLSPGQQLRIAQHMRELENAVRRGGVVTGPLGASSTAWHRTASRLESYVDLGLLEKGLGGEEELYEYVYYPTPALGRAVSSLEAASSAEGWLEEGLIAALYPEVPLCGSIHPEELPELLQRVAASLERPTAPLPIISLALGLVWLKMEEGKAASIGECRRRIEELARMRPDFARLSRGRAGERAEFVSLAQRALRS